MSRVSVVCALAENGTIGRDNQLPWRLPSDLKRFRELTWGHHLIMGRKTYESIGRPLPGRTTIVLSRSPSSKIDSVQVVPHLAAALDLAADDEEVFIVGGRSVYEAALRIADRLYLTHVAAEVEGDITFPPLDWREWTLVAEDSHPGDERHDYPYRFCVYDSLTVRDEANGLL